jgi:hypothetical protein
MPNWCDNAATLSSSKEKIDALVAVLENKDDQAVFQHLRPRPESEEEKKYYAGALRRRQLRLILSGKMQPNDATELKALFTKD